MGYIICVLVLGGIAIACFVFAYMQFNEKGYLFNNTYIYSSKQERETMDKKAYYRQSGVVLLLIGIIFLINAVETILKTGWLFYIVISIAIIAIVYAVVSSIVIEKRKK